MKISPFQALQNQKLLIVVCSILFFLFLEAWVGSTPSSNTVTNSHLQRAKIYLVAGDYRRAMEACQQYLDERPSVEGYIYLAYVYEAIDGYLDALAERDEWVKVGQLSLNLTARDALDLIDPPNVLPRMAKEIIHEGIRQQFDVTAAMANRIDRDRSDQMWAQQTVWRKAHPDRWWAGVPDVWGW